MSSKDFVSALAKGSNLDAEDAFKSAIGNKVTDALETKRHNSDLLTSSCVIYPSSKSLIASL